MHLMGQLFKEAKGMEDLKGGTKFTWYTYLVYLAHLQNVFIQIAK